MLARLKEVGWLGMTTGMRESVEATVQAEDLVAREAEAASGRVKKPGQVELAGQIEQAGGVPYEEGPQPAQPVPSAESSSGAGQVMGAQSRVESGVGMLGCKPGPH